MKAGGSSKKIANNLVALSSAAVVAVYAAGYLRTRAAAERFDQAAQRMTSGPPAIRAEAPPPPAPPVTSVVAPPVSTPVVVPVAPKPAATPASDLAPAAASAETTSTAVTAATPTTAAPATATPPAPPAATPPASTVPPTVDPPTPDPPAAPQPIPYKDGTYYGWGSSRHGSIQAAVVIDGGKIVSASIAQCLTRYSCSWISHLPPQVVTRQSANVDYVSGATQSTYAFYDAIVEALSKAK